jgi:hypothetical protein
MRFCASSFDYTSRAMLMTTKRQDGSFLLKGINDVRHPSLIYEDRYGNKNLLPTIDIRQSAFLFSFKFANQMLKRFVSFFNTPGTTLMHHK